MPFAGAHRLLADAAACIGHLPIRVRGTIGGSLAHADPAAELPLAALALDASMLVRSASAERRVAAEEFFLGPFTTALEPDELLTALVVPAAPAGAGAAFAEFAVREGDFALVSVAVVIAVAGGRIDARAHRARRRRGDAVQGTRGRGSARRRAPGGRSVCGGRRRGGRRVRSGQRPARQCRSTGASSSPSSCARASSGPAGARRDAGEAGAHRHERHAAARRGARQRSRPLRGRRVGARAVARARRAQSDGARAARSGRRSRRARAPGRGRGLRRSRRAGRADSDPARVRVHERGRGRAAAAARPRRGALRRRADRPRHRRGRRGSRRTPPSSWSSTSIRCRWPPI